MENEKVIVVAGLSIKNGMEGEFVKHAKEIVNLTRKEEGCLRYDFFEDALEKNKFMFYEEYVNAEAFAAHRQMPYMDAFREKREKAVEKYLGVQELKLSNSR